MTNVMNMKLVSKKLRGLGLAALLVGVAASALAQTYSVIDLGTLPGWSNSYANGVNNGGQVVGYSYQGPDGGDRAFLYSGGTMIDLGTLPGGGFSGTNALGINDSGQVVGNCYINGPNFAFLYSGGTMIGLPGGGNVFAQGINNSDRLRDITGPARFYTVAEP